MHKPSVFNINPSVQTHFFVSGLRRELGGHLIYSTTFLTQARGLVLSGSYSDLQDKQFLALSMHVKQDLSHPTHLPA